MQHRHSSLGWVVVGMLGVACSAVWGSGMAFQSRAGAVGLTGGHLQPANDFALQYMAPGGAVGDFNRDGAPDVFVIGGSNGVDQLYINNGDGTFSNQAAAWGVAAAGIRHTGAAVGDFDNDGRLDIFVTCVRLLSDPNDARNRLYRNNGDGTFTDVAASAGVQVVPSQLSDSFGAAFGDYDLDGHLDLFVAGWYGGNILYRNNGDGAFTAQPNAIFIGDDITTVRGFAPRFIDMNDDGWPDILLAADFFTSRIYLNNGDGTFTNVTEAWGAGLDSNGMGHAVGDLNNNGLYDWYVTSRIAATPGAGSGNMLYMHNGAGFTERSVPAGVNFGWWGWGADAVDFDHDGWLDLVATNGWSGSAFTNKPTYLWRNLRDPDGIFQEIAASVGLNHTGQGRGLLTFDADMDGDRDLLIFNNNQALSYFENQLPTPGSNSITFFFDTKGQPGLAPDGFGVRADLDAGGMTQRRYLDGGNTYLAQSELSLHFGLGEATIADEVRIRWPDGRQTTLVGVRPGRYTITARFDCSIDWDVNGLLDLADITGWITGFLEQHPQADLTGDGVFDLADLIAFATAFISGCP